MKTKVSLDDLKVGDTIEFADGTTATVTDVDASDDSEHEYVVSYRTKYGVDYWYYHEDGTGATLTDEVIVAIHPRRPKLSHEEVIEELVIEADALEKDLEEAYVMIDACDMELDELKIEADDWKRIAKVLHELYKEQVEINKAKQDELDFQSEQLEEFMLGDFDDEVTIEFVSLDDLVGTEDELYDPFKADRFN